MGREERKGRSKFPFLHGEKGSRMQKRLERGQCDLGLDLGGNLLGDAAQLPKEEGWRN